MRRIFSFAAPAILAVTFAACTDSGTTPTGGQDPLVPPVALPPAEKAVVQAGNDFSFRLLVELNKEYAGQNVFISPLSVSMALGMTMNGARGATQSAMATTLGFGTLAQDDINRSYGSLTTLLTGLDPTVNMQIANAIWYRPSLVVVDSFRTVNMTYFNAEVNSVDFSIPTAADVINNWVSQHTYGKITKIVTPPIPADVMMYLINAVYFKGSWTYRYDPQYTKTDQFTRDDGSQATCSMMSQTDTIPYFAAGGVQVADIPYGSGSFSMTVVLPPPGVSIDAFVGSLTQAQWNSWISGLSRKAVALWMPKFKIQYGAASLVNTLKALGMGIAFSGSADFTGIDTRGSLAISDVLHKTFVQVDEVGTEAAAVTVVIIRATVAIGGQEDPIMLRLNRPFIYAIREHATGSLVFVGKLASPEWTD